MTGMELQGHGGVAVAELAGPPPQYEAGMQALGELLDLDGLRKIEIGASPGDFVRSPFFYGHEGVVQTPLEPMHSRWGEHVTIFDKLEVEQRMVAFKVRGAYAGGEDIMRRFPSVQSLVTHSAGNHALGTAQFVKAWNIRNGAVVVDDEGRIIRRHPERMLKAHIFLPAKASGEKVGRILRYSDFGVTLHQGGKDLAAAEKLSLQFLGQLNAGLPPELPVAAQLHPYANPAVWVGQSTALLEVFVQLRNMYGPKALQEIPLEYDLGYGGGGLANGSALLMNFLKEWGLVHHDSKVKAWQMDGCDSTVRALWRLDRGLSLKKLFGPGEFDPSADGTAVEHPDPGNLALTKYLRDKGVLEVGSVPKSEVGRVMDNHPALPEPAGALGAAGAELSLDGQMAYWIANGCGPEDRRYVVRALSGGNRSEATVTEFRASQLAAAVGHRSLSAAFPRW